MSLPEGVIAPSNMVCKLIKSLYGLKQSSRAWYMCFDTYLLQQGFSRLEADANIYVKHDNDDGFTILTVYVDDCILISNHISLIHKIKAILHTTFEMIDEGEINYILGNSIIRNRHEGWTILHQQKYLLDKFAEYHMSNCNSIRTPMQCGIKLSKDDSPSTTEERDLVSSYSYSQLVGSLMHAQVNSQPDCAYIINSLAQYLSNPGIIHVQTLKRTMCYIKVTLSYGIKYQKLPNGDILHGFLMLIGLEIKILVGQLQVIVFYWLVELFHGVAKSNKVLLYHQLNQNIWPWQKQQQKPFGCENYYVN